MKKDVYTKFNGGFLGVGGGGGVGRELIMGGYGRANTVIGLFEKVSHMAQKNHGGMQETCWDKTNKELCVI